MQHSALLAVALAGGLAAGCTASAPAAAKASAPPVAVTLGRAEVADLSSPFEGGGVVRARSTAVIASRVMAPITDVLIRPGDRVRRGAPLVRLDAREINATATRASASLGAARQAVEAAAADRRAADAGLRIAKLTHDRIAGLHEKGSATQQELDQVTASFATAEAQVGAASAREAAATAAREEAEAAVQAAQVASSYTLLAAPFDGLITERIVDPGTMATPGAPLLTLEEEATFRLEVRLDEARAALVAVGQNADVSLSETSASSAVWRPVRIVEISRLDAASHGFVVKLDVPAGVTVRTGQFGRARFQGPARRTLTVPASAAIRRGQLWFVFTVDAIGVARLRPISVGAVVSDRVEVLAGVHEGDRVVTSPPATLVEDSRITGDR